jgi:hypothetical protein
MHRRLSVSSACDLGSASARDTVALREQQSHTDLSLGRFVSYLGKKHFCNVPEGNTLLTSYFVQKCANVFYLRDSH